MLPVSVLVCPVFQVIVNVGDAVPSSWLHDDVVVTLLAGTVPDTIDAQVSDGVVTLTGSADFQFERDEAEFAVAEAAEQLRSPVTI